MTTGETKFSILVSLFTWIQKTRTSAKKRTKFRKFLDAYCKPDDYFSAIRLILPSLDRERGSYGLKESVLATSLIDVLGMSRDSEDAVRLINWRKGGAKTGTNAGNFALVASEVLQRRQGMTSGGLTIKELNDLLDQLASSENRAEKTSVLSTMIKKTNAQEMKWIIMIILKDLKLGISEKSIFHEFHPDAEDLFNVTCDLKLVCEKLRDSTQRHKRQDIEVGKAVRPQLAMRVSDPAAAWKKLHGKDVLVECKFDGDRIQIHKNGAEIHYYSRNFLDHSEYAHGMSDIIMQNILVDRCILDGEMLVWDTSSNRFADFGSNQEIAKAAKDGLDSERQLCYVAFDILYVGDTSVIHQSLKERHDLLKNVVKPLEGRLDILVPNSGLNNHRLPGEPCWSRLAHSLDEVERFFKETIENRDEGIMLKDYDSKWEPSDRSGKWLKLKPDYIRAGSDLDVLIIGGYYGSGRRGGEVAQFLLGMAERPDPNTYPRRFLSFCRVGTGLTDEELDALVRKLKPYFRKYEYPKKAHPSFYQVTNNSKERPDVWIESPEKSVILSITSDIRTVNSEVFAAPYSLRFPRIDRVRYDKPWHECLDVQSFIELVHSSDGRTQKGTEYETMQGSKLKRKRPTRKGEKKTVSMVPSQFIQTDTSGIKGETLIFSNLMFYFVNVPATNSLDSLHKMVVENGGMFSMNLNSSVTHCIAAESKGIKYQAAKLRGDIIHFSWLLDCCSQKKLIPLQLKYFLFLSDSSKMKFQEEVDEYSDPYYWDVDLSDLKQLLKDIKRSENAQTILYYKNKYCPKDKWSRFNECSVYFYLLAQSGKPDCEFMLRLALRRLELEVLMGGGKVSKDLKHATHLVVLSLPGANVDFSTLIKSFSGAEKRCIWKTEFHVVRSQWLEDCLEKEEKLLEDPYNLKPAGVEGSDSLECQDLGLDDGSHDLPSVQNQNTSAILESPGTDEERESKADLENSKLLVLPEDGNGNRGRGRGRPAGKSTKRIKVGSNPTRRSQARRGKIPAKIYDEESDESGSNVKECEEEIDEGGNPVTAGMFRKDKERESVHLESSKSSVLPEDGNRKRGRGRPAGKSTKVGSNPIRRPQTRRGKVPAKINDEESDESGSDGKVREEQTDKEDRNSESVGTFGKEDFGIDGTIVEDSESSPYRGKTIQEVEMPVKKMDEMGKGKDTEKVGMIQNMEMNRADFGQEEKKHDRLEVMVDPVQAMLLDMIPSLGMKREPEPEPSRAIVKDKKRPAVTSAGKNHEPEHSDSIVEDKKRSAETSADSQVEDKKPQTSASAELQALDENPPEEDIRRPSKKKKVSYKELAGELLKEYGRNT